MGGQFERNMQCTKKEILIVSPFVRKRHTMKMIQHMRIALDKGSRKIVVTRLAESFKAKDRFALERVLEMLKGNGISVVFRPNILQKFAVMDQKTVWYGSINLLSYGSAQEASCVLKAAIYRRS